MFPFDYGPVGISVHNNKVLSTLIVENIFADALEGVVWCLNRVRWCIGL